MKLRTFILGAICISGFSAYAQEGSTPAVEAGFNYSFTRVNTGGSTLGSYNSNGGSGYVEVNVNRVVGLVADLGANYNGNVKGFPIDNTTFTYLFGPRFNWRMSRFTPYFQTLIGGARFSNAYDAASPTPILGVSENTFAATMGVGLDVKLTDHVSLKPVQLEYLTTQLRSAFVNGVQNDLRYSAGVVFEFGSKSH